MVGYKSDRLFYNKKYNGKHKKSYATEIRGEKLCTHCFRHGHFRKECRVLNNQCYICGSDEHFLSQCSLKRPYKTKDSWFGFSRNKLFRDNLITRQHEIYTETCRPLFSSSLETTDVLPSVFQSTVKVDSFVYCPSVETLISKNQMQQDYLEDRQAFLKNRFALLEDECDEEIFSVATHGAKYRVCATIAETTLKKQSGDLTKIVKSAFKQPAICKRVADKLGSAVVQLGYDQQTSLTVVASNSSSSEVRIENHSEMSGVFSNSFSVPISHVYEDADEIKTLKCAGDSWITPELIRQFETLQKQLPSYLKYLEESNSSVCEPSEESIESIVNWSYTDGEADEVLSCTENMSAASELVHEKDFITEVSSFGQESAVSTTSDTINLPKEFLSWLGQSLQALLEHVEKVNTISRLLNDEWLQEVSDVLSLENYDDDILRNNRMDVLAEMKSNLNRVIDCVRDLQITENSTELKETNTASLNSAVDSDDGISNILNENKVFQDSSTAEKNTCDFRRYLHL